jgi:hypothetical protein
MLVLGGVHVASHFVGGLPQFLLKTKLCSIRIAVIR